MRNAVYIVGILFLYYGFNGLQGRRRGRGLPQRHRGMRRAQVWQKMKALQKASGDEAASTISLSVEPGQLCGKTSRGR